MTDRKLQSSSRLRLIFSVSLILVILFASMFLNGGPITTGQLNKSHSKTISENSAALVNHHSGFMNPITNVAEHSTSQGSFNTTFSAAVAGDGNKTTLQNGFISYYYAGASGGQNITTPSFSPDLSVDNQYSNPFIFIGRSTSNVGSYNAGSTLYPYIEGVGSSQQPSSFYTFYDRNSTSLVCNLSLSNSSTLLVVAAVSSLYDPNITSTFSILANASNSVVDGGLIAYKSQAFGSVSFKIDTTPWVLSSAAIAVVVYVFYKAKFNVNFEETGLPAGTPWGLNIGSASETVSAPSNISYSFDGGRLQYYPFNVSGYKSLSSGVIDQGSQNVTVYVPYFPISSQYFVTNTIYTNSTPTLNFSSSVTSTLIILFSSFELGGVTSTTISLNAQSLDFTTGKVAQGFYGSNQAFSGILVMKNMSAGSYVASVDVSSQSYSTMSVIQVSPDTTIAYGSNVSRIDTTAASLEMPLGYSNYIYVGASIDPSISTIGNAIGALNLSSSGYTNYVYEGTSNQNFWNATCISPGNNMTLSAVAFSNSNSTSIQPKIQPKYEVVFIESGLSGGTLWEVTFNGTYRTSHSNSIYFNITNGSYAYNIIQVPNYTASPSNGNVLVSGKLVTVTIMFSPVVRNTSPPGGGVLGSLLRSLSQPQVIVGMIFTTIFGILGIYLRIIQIRRNRN